MMVHYSKFDFDMLPDCELVNGKNVCYINTDFAVDIETTSFYDGDHKRAYPYIFMCNLSGQYIYCRYIEELAEIFQRIKKRYSLRPKRRIIMYVHFLSFEFQFFRDICDFDEVFARTSLKPMKCYDKKSCIEFRCSNFLSGLSLANVAENLKSTKIEKLSGDDYDYKKIRHSETPLTEKEMMYCEHDVAILHYYIQEEMKRNGGDITKIPLTQTGYIRRECRERIFSAVNRAKYHYMISRDSPDLELFELLHKAFAGGDTHANYLHANCKVKDVSSFDFASSYPAVMVKCKFPYKFVKTEIFNTETLETLLEKKACVFKCSFEEIEAIRHHHTLSFSHCETIKDYVLDNGRVVKGKFITTWFTDIDYKDFIKTYKIKGRRIIKFYYSNYNYLPTPFVEFILELFKNKTTLKGLSGELNKALYQQSKEFINGLYGMSVTNIVNDEHLFGEYIDNETQEIKVGWYPNKVDPEKALIKYKNNWGSFLLYQWGVWVTSWARHFLHETIMKIEDNSKEFDDFVYCDTDSVKIRNVDRHMKIIEEYNKQNNIDMINAMMYHGFDITAYTAKTKKGELKTLGIWENETLDKNGKQHPYKLFKTLGAKRYMYYDDRQPSMVMGGYYHLTVSGLNPKIALPYILHEGKIWDKWDGGFDVFTDQMKIPPEYTGKSTHTYIDDEYEIMLTDYTGITSCVHQKHYIHLEEQEYTLKLNHKFDEILEEFFFGCNDIGQPYDDDNKMLRVRTIFY